jgi:uncharacterized membrane protein YfcA
MLLAAAGFVAGLVNGLLGAGGGIIVVFALSRLLGRQLDDGRDAFSNALAVMLPLSVVSAVGYALRGVVPEEKLGVLVIPAVLGGLLGGILLYSIEARWVRVLFSAIVVWSGISMLTG